MIVNTPAFARAGLVGNPSDGFFGKTICLGGYYGELRLIKAAVVRFFRHCQTEGLGLCRRNFTIRYDSDVPVRVGLPGSSAIITATLRALMHYMTDLVEKPSREEAPSRMAIAGRYVLPPQVFPAIAGLEPGAGGGNPADRRHPRTGRPGAGARLPLRGQAPRHRQPHRLPALHRGVRPAAPGRRPRVPRVPRRNPGPR